MAFRIKDLLINIAPGGRRLCPGRSDTGHPTPYYFTCPCPGGTDTGHSLPCFYYTNQCPNYTRPCPAYYSRWFGDDPVVAAEELAVLKAELKKELEMIEQQEKLVEESLRPKDLDEVIALEHKLEEALEEVKRLRSELESERKKK